MMVLESGRGFAQGMWVNLGMRGACAPLARQLEKPPREKLDGWMDGWIFFSPLPLGFFPREREGTKRGSSRRVVLSGERIFYSR